MLAVVLAALLSAAPGGDVVITSDGTRVTGTVVEETPDRSVTLQLPDGSIRTFQRGEVARIEFSDGSVSDGRMAQAEEPPPPPPMAKPAPAPAPPPPPERRADVAGPVDTVYFVGGGRVRGTVLEESPREGVTIRLLDGSVRQYPRREIARILYADGSVSRRRTSPAPAPAPYPPPRAYPPPAYPPPPAAPADAWRPPAARPLVPIYLAAGVGASFFGGDADDQFSMDQTVEPQGHLSLEGGLRLSPNIALGLYGDIGAGDPAREVRDDCALSGLSDCVATSGRIGFLVRLTLDPEREVSKWLTIGTGWEFANVSGDDDFGSMSDELFTYRGREWLRLHGGLDFRSNGVLGVGFYGGVGFGEFTRFEQPGQPTARLDGELHTTVQAGVRFTLFP